MINEFVDKIIVHAPEKGENGDCVQEVEIYFKFIGKFKAPMPEPAAEELARQEQLRKGRIRSRKRYRRVKSGEIIPGRPFELVCKNCYKPFTSMRSNTIYCGAACREQYYRKKQKQKKEK